MVPLLAFYNYPEVAWTPQYRALRADRQTDNIMMPIADHAV